MPITDQLLTEYNRIDSIFRPFAEKMDRDIDYARAKIIEKGLVRQGINPDELSLRVMIDLLAEK